MVILKQNILIGKKIKTRLFSQKLAIFGIQFRHQMKRIMIFGVPGSGKSTWSIRLSERLNIPVYHLDRYFFVEDWKERNNQEFLQMQQDLISKDCWIIDGNCMRSLEMRFSRADTAFYFHFPRLLCLWRIFKRLFHRDKQIADRAEGCSEQVSWKLIVYLWKYDKKYKSLIEGLHEKYPHVKFYVLRNEQEVADIQVDI